MSNLENSNELLKLNFIKQCANLFSWSKNSTKLHKLKVMKRWANGLLLLVSGIFILTVLLEKQYPWLGFIRAMAEAAMVGAIADWFAVTALFRHPFVIETKHTAIIPNSKQLIGQQLGRFVKVKFLSEEVMSKQLQTWRITYHLVEWVSKPINRERIAQETAIGLAAIVQVLHDDEVQKLIESKLSDQIRSTQFTPKLGQVLTKVMAGERQRQLLFWTVELGSKFLQDNKELIIKVIKEQFPKLVPNFLKLDYKIYEKIVETMERLLQEASNDPTHPLHASFDTALNKLLADLQTSPDVLIQEQAIKEDLLGQHSVIREISASVWGEIKNSLLERSHDPEQGIHAPIQQMLTHLIEALRNDSVLFEKVDQGVNNIILYCINTYGHKVEDLISQTIEGWDTEKITNELELEVGPDLQFIRINGTIIGGLVGLVIYTVSFLIRQWS